MRTSIPFLMIATFIMTTPMSMLAGAAPIAPKATIERCDKVYDKCAQSPLCKGGITKNHCIGRCINAQSLCLRSSSRPSSSRAAVNQPTNDGKRSDSASARFTKPVAPPSLGTRDGRNSTTFRTTVPKPVVHSPPTDRIAPRPILRGQGGTGCGRGCK
jgi:hypothetical protein